LTPRGDAFFEKAINMLHHYVKEVSRDNSSTPYGSEAFAYRIACAIGSTIGVLHKWVKEDFQVPESEIADILTQAFMSGILPFLSRETQ
jgi:hypothetical protein